MTPDLLKKGAQRVAEHAKLQAESTESGGRSAGYGRVVQDSTQVDVTHGRILYLEDVTVRFGGFRALNALTLSDLSGQISTFDIGLKRQVGDIVSVTHPVGLTAKQFWVMGVTDDGFGDWTLALAEYDAAIQSSVVVSDPSTPDSGLAIPGVPPTLTGLTAAEEIYRTGDGLISSRLRITWTDPAWPNALNVLVTISEGSTLIHSGSAWSAW